MKTFQQNHNEHELQAWWEELDSSVKAILEETASIRKIELPRDLSVLVKLHKHVLHPKLSKDMFVYYYKSSRGTVPYTVDGDIVYFETSEAARRHCGNRPCWSISKIKNPKGL